MAIFHEYLKISLWIIPVILLALWLLPKLSQKYSSKLSYFVWLVIAVRLLIPWNMTLPVERAPIQLDIPQESIMEWTPTENPVENITIRTETEVNADNYVFVEPETNMDVPNDFTFSLGQIILLFWSIGVIVSVIHPIIATFRLKKLIRRWEKQPSETTVEVYKKISGDRKPPIAVCSVLATPMAVGLVHTKIYLPHEEYSEQELEMILKHELIHWERKDLWYKFLLLLARGIHWFNPFVYLMVKRANRDLEISCDGEAVKEKDMDYRKAYGLMILHEAERGLQRQVALTTCFTDGKRALQERLVEIMNGKKRKKGMALVAMTLVLALSCGCLVSYGGSDPISENTDVALVEGTKAMATAWAEALKSRDGKPRYDMMSAECKAAFIEEQKAGLGDDWNYVIGWSSPWVISYSIEMKENSAIITYTMQDSNPQQYVMKELLKFGEENGKLVVVDHFYSNIYWEDGEVHPIISRTGEEIDEGIWDFMHQSVVGFIGQSKWKIYELEEYNFDIKSVTTELLRNGNNQVTVDFALKVTDRNPFRDPDEAGYIKRAKEAGHPHYQILYDEYYQQKESNMEMRFICEVLPNTEKIYEDTCNPDSFCLQYGDYVGPFAEEPIVYSSAAGGFYDETPADGWFAYISATKWDDNVTVHRQIRIQDKSRRTNNGYFDLRLEQGGIFEVAEDAVIIMGGAGEGTRTLTREEWINWLKEGTNYEGGNFTLVFEKDENGYDVITEAREGHWKTVGVKASDTSVNSSFPSGYPTDSRTISTPFTIMDGIIKHTGIDFPTHNKNIPVLATADGLVSEAGFDTKNGNYVKVNHLNGYTTLYAHMSELDVKAGDKVVKGDILGLTGKTGMAVGIHCHYEIQLNGIYQDPADYL